MEAVHPESGLVDRHSPLYAVPGVESRVQDELAAQLDSAVAFADFCTFLTSGRVSDLSDELIRLAQILYAETTGALSRSASPGESVRRDVLAVPVTTEGAKSMR